MSYTVGNHFVKFIREQVANGRYNNASEVVREGLRLVEEREMKLKSLKAHLSGAIERGGSITSKDVNTSVKAKLKLLNRA